MGKDFSSYLGDAIAGIAIGIIGGLSLGAFLDYFISPRCPSCNQPVKKGVI